MAAKAKPAEPEKVPDPALQVGPEAESVPKAFPFPGDTQSGGSRHPAPGYISAGVKSDAETYGSTIDPATGKRVTREDLK